MKSLALFAALVTALLPFTAYGQTPPDLQKKRETLSQIFRATRDGALMPAGPIYTDYIGPARVASEAPPTCASQVLTLYEQPGLRGGGRDMQLRTDYRFLARNDGTPSRPDDLLNRCEAESIHKRWFSIYDVDEGSGLAAAWAASGALNAIASGAESYDGIDLAKFARKPRGDSQLSIKAFSKTGTDDVSYVQTARIVSESPSQSTLATKVTFNSRGCEVTVEVIIDRRYIAQANAYDRQAKAISIDDVQCYVA